MVIGLGCFAIGCGGDPGVSVEVDVPEAEEIENADMGGAGADGLGAEEAGEDAPPDSSDALPE